MAMSNVFGDKMGKRLVDKFFRKVDDVLWDLMSGRVGVRTSDGEIATLEGEGDEAGVVVNPFSDFGVPLPAFAQSTPVADIKKGDLIYNSKKVMGWVVSTPSAKAKAFRLLKPDGTRGEWRPPKVTSLGIDLSGAMVLRSLVNTLPGGGLGNLQGMLLPLLMTGGDFGDLEDMLPLILMGQGGMLGGDPSGGGMGNMLQMMMLMKMMGGKNKGGTSPVGKGSFFDRLGQD